MSVKYDCLITFKSIHEVMKLEEILVRKDIDADIMPLPRKISDSCGMGVIFFSSQLEEVKFCCEDNDLEFKSVYEIKNGDINLFI